MKSLIPCLFALSLGTTASPALADDDCDAPPVGRWQPRDAVLQHAARQGWQVQRLKIDDGCYEIRGQDAQGRAFKARLDPETLRVVKMKWRDRDHERHHERTRGQDAAPAAPPALGTTPRGQTE